MLRRHLPLLGAGLVLAATFSLNAFAHDTATAPAIELAESQLDRGKYLVDTMGCTDCHTPFGPDAQPIMELHMAGHPADAPLPEWDPSMFQKNVLATISPSFTAFAGPFGVAIAGNLTPDMETGIGKLTAEMLIESWRTGKHWKFDQRPVLPPMPMHAYSHLTDDDIRAIHAYLMSLPPIKNACPPSVINMPPPGPAGDSHGG